MGRSLGMNLGVLLRVGGRSIEQVFFGGRGKRNC